MTAPPRPRLKHRVDFAGLFEVPAPNLDLLEYYVETLAQSAQYAHLPELLTQFEEFERGLAAPLIRVEEESANNLLAQLQGKTAAMRLQSAQWGGAGEQAEDRRLSLTDEVVLRVELAQGPYSVLLNADKTAQLPAYWAGLCQECAVPPVLARSQVFRKEVLERLLPNGLLEFQEAILRNAFAALQALGISEANLVALTPEVLEVNAGKQHASAFALLKAHAKLGKHLHVTAERHEMLRADLHLRHRLSDPKHTGSTVAWTGLCLPDETEFYVLFKRHVLNQPQTEHDLYFRYRGRLAKWVH